MRVCNVEIDLERTKLPFIGSVDLSRMVEGKRLKLGLVWAIGFDSKMETINYRTASRKELDIVFQWAADEGWNPGVGDADIFWETDPKGFVVVESKGEVVGTGSIVSYGDFGFMGFFIVKKALRGQGIGTGFWHWRKETLKQRLNPGSTIGMDGVFDM